MSFAAAGGNIKGEGGVGYESGPLQAPVEAFKGIPGILEFGNGYSTTVFRCSDGSEWAVGDGAMGSRGDGSRRESSRPTRTKLPAGVSAAEIATGGAGTITRTPDGRLFAMGSDVYGGCGDGHEGHGYDKDIPVQVQGLPGVLRVFAGGGCRVVETTDGWYGFGELEALGLPGIYPLPKKLNWPPGVKTVVICGVPSWGGHVLLIMEDGTVLAAGDNGSGQLGIGTTAKKPVQGLVKVQVTDVVEAAGSVSHSLFRHSDGTVSVCGAGTYGELANGQTADLLVPTKIPLPEPIVQVLAPWRASIFITASGVVLACGWSQHGVTGLGKEQEVVSAPTLVPGISGVKHGWCGEYTVIYEADHVTGRPFVLTATKGGIKVDWMCGKTTKAFDLKIRKRGSSKSGPWEAKAGGKAGLGVDVRSYEFTKLTAGVEYEVHIANPAMGNLTGIAVPL